MSLIRLENVSLARQGKHSCPILTGQLKRPDLGYPWT